MRKPDLRYWVLWSFLLGIIFIVFLQVISGYNITRLLQGNKSLTEEMQVQNNLRKLQSDVLTVESDIRGAVITGDAGYLSGVTEKIRSIDLEIQQLKAPFDSTRLSADYYRLHQLVQRKIRFSNQILTSFQQQGKDAAERLINTDQGRVLRDSIEQIISSLDHLRQTELRQIAGNIEKSGRSTRFWGFGIGFIALIAVVSAFWYMLNQGRQQQQMINLLKSSSWPT
jgi:CHASE3 domain sensor protein